MQVQSSLRANCRVFIWARVIEKREPRSRLQRHHSRRAQMIERTKSSAFGAAIGGRAKSRTAGRSAVCEQIQLSLRANCRVLIWGQIGKTKKENALRSLFVLVTRSRIELLLPP